MGTRRKARELALKVIFEFDFSQTAIERILSRIKSEQAVAPEVLGFTGKLLDTYVRNQKVVNATIEEHSSNWKLSRMATVDRNILRLGAVEILFFADIPKSVTINEYLEISKKYGSEESSGFVNGILDKIEK